VLQLISLVDIHPLIEKALDSVHVSIRNRTNQPPLIDTATAAQITRRVSLP
jgi:hypothetical protein